MYETEEQSLRANLADVQRRLNEAAVSTPESLGPLSREEKLLSSQAALFDQLRQTEQKLREGREMLTSETDTELKAMAQAEVDEAEAALPTLEQAVQTALLPADPHDFGDAVLEIRSGVGGDEAELFASELLRMYSRYAERHGLHLEIDSLNQTSLGGIKEAVVEVHGGGTYGLLKFESGVHRVQRVPETEKAGRIHTSTATVAVLPLSETAEIDIRPEDLRIDVYRSSGNGGQSVNTTDSAVRLTHLPTGLVVTCQDEKSQLKNKDKAMRVLRARLLSAEQERLQKERGEERLLQIGGGDRSEKIRTYNFPQDRLSDHRINYTTHGLPRILDGDIDELTHALAEADMADRLARAGHHA